MRGYLNRLGNNNEATCSTKNPVPAISKGVIL